MKILMVGPNANSKGGIASVIANFKTYYQGNSIEYLDSWQEKRRFITGIRAFFKIKRKVEKEQFDVVHFHVAQRGSFVRKALLATRVRKQTKVLFHMHASQFDTFYSDASPMMKKYIRKTLNQLDGLVVLSKEWADFYENLTDTPITVIENAVLVPAEINYNSQSTKIITFGRIGVRKGSYDILEIAKKIEVLFPEVTFILYGDGEVEKVRGKLKEQQIKNVQLGGWINKNEQENLMKDAVLHFLPSYQEGLPMAILETMSYGIPNLSTNVGGIPQVLKDMKNGMVTSPGDNEKMVEKLIYFLSNEDIRLNYSRASYETILHTFSINPYFEKWSIYYDEL